MSSEYVQDDLDRLSGGGGLGGAQADGGIGFDWEADPNAGEGETRFQPGEIPRSEFYYVRVTSVDARMQPESFDIQEIEGVVRVEVIEGIEETKGRTINGRFVLAPNKVRFEGPKGAKVKRPNTPEEQKVDNGRFAQKVNRFVRIMQLATTKPAARTVEAVKAWLAPAIGKEAIVTAYSKNGFSEIEFSNMRAPGDAATDPKNSKKLFAGVTCLEQARAAIAEHGKPKGGRKGASASGRGAAAPSDFS